MAEFNKNMLSPTGFSFHIQKLPEFNFFVQEVTLPGVNLPLVEQPNPFKKIPVSGDHIEYGDLSVSFKVNEDLGNYIEVFNWIKGLGFPDNFGQYKDLANADSAAGQGLESDAYLMVLSSAMNPIVRIDFMNLFPTSLTDIVMNSQDSALEYITATATFRFLNYKFTSVS